MTEKDIFIVNNKVEIIWNDGYYKSNIEDLTDDIISISIPSQNGEYIPLRMGEPVEVLYYLDNKIYKFYSVVRGRKHDRIPIIMIEMPNEIHEVQRRQSVRVSILGDVLYSKIGANENIYDIIEIKKKDNFFSKATILDLSAYGMKINIKDHVKLHERLLICINFDEEELYIIGTIVRVEKVDKNMYICGISFVDLERRTADKIVRYIFAIMRSQMKKIDKGD